MDATTGSLGDQIDLTCSSNNELMVCQWESPTQSKIECRGTACNTNQRVGCSKCQV